MRTLPLWPVLIVGMAWAADQSPNTTSESSRTGTKPLPVAQPVRSPAATAERAARPTAKEAVIGHIELRDRSVTVRSTAAGLRYTIRAANGTVLHRDLTLDQLQARAPHAAEVMRTGWARQTRPGVQVDAALRFERR